MALAGLVSIGLALARLVSTRVALVSTRVALARSSVHLSGRDATVT
jgi:hypothetical protein